MKQNVALLICAVFIIAYGRTSKEEGSTWAAAAVVIWAMQKEKASAPELLAALRTLRSFMWAEGYADQTPAMAQADAAIAKAEVAA